MQSAGGRQGAQVRDACILGSILGSSAAKCRANTDSGRMLRRTAGCQIAGVPTCPYAKHVALPFLGGGGEQQVLDVQVLASKKVMACLCLTRTLASMPPSGGQGPAGTAEGTPQLHNIDASISPKRPCSLEDGGDERLHGLAVHLVVVHGLIKHVVKAAAEEKRKD